MSIRSNTRPIGWDLHPDLQDILRRNGMQAHVIREGESYKLFVQGHDSPMLSYDLDAHQLKKLTDWGTNFANKSAYNTLVDLVDKDFYLPRNFVHARNANGRVAMGLHGYRIGVGEYGRMPIDGSSPLRHFFGPSFLGWTPRQQAGFHMRRIGPAMFMQPGAPIVPGRPDGRMKPGELQNGGYGFYYKGRQTPPETPKVDVLKELETVIKPIQPAPRPPQEAIPYKDLVNSPVYFSNEKWQQSLQSHGIVIDAQAKTLTIQSTGTNHDLMYDLSDSELKQLTSNSLKESPLENRLNVINDVVKADYASPVTMDMLNSKQVLDIPLRPEVEQTLNQKEKQLVEEVPLQETEQVVQQPLTESKQQDDGLHINGNVLSELNSKKAWYREDGDKEQVQVDDINVSQDTEGKYKMTAVINGESITHEISAKQFEKFSAIDEYHRLKLFDKIFDEVDMKTMPDKGFNLLAAVSAGLTVARDLVKGPQYGPAIYEEHFSGPHVYFKPGVDTPQDLASRAFDAGVNAAESGIGLAHQR